MRRSVVLGTVAVLALLTQVPPALGAFGFRELGFEAADESGAVMVTAGAHPSTIAARIAFNLAEREDEADFPDRQVRHLDVALPPGFVGDPFAADRCPSARFADISMDTGLPDCPDGSAVGLLGVRASLDEPQPGQKMARKGFVPLYNLEPGPGLVAQFGAAVFRVPVVINVRLSESPPYRVVASLKNIPQSLHIFESEAILWGDPASPLHDAVRGSCLDAVNAGEGDEPTSIGECPVASKGRPFLTLPRHCAGPLEARFVGESWDQPPARDQGVAQSPGTEECSSLDFAAAAALQFAQRAADSPSGLHFKLQVEDPGLVSTAPGQRANSDIRKTVVMLPPGVTLNPAIAGGLDACSTADLKRETAFSPPGAGCPEASKIGSVSVRTPLLDRTLAGALYTAKPLDNPFGSLLALYLVIKDARYGIAVKLAGKVDSDPQTGRLVATFDELPQIPLSEVHVSLRDGPRAPLITPRACGSYHASVELTPWAGSNAPVTSTSRFDIAAGPGGSGCPAGDPFAVALDAGTVNPLAGAFSPMLIRMSRQDGSQRIAGVDLSLPRGITAKLAGTQYCPEAILTAIASRSQPGEGRQEVDAPSCPPLSFIGRVAVTAGAGSLPVYVDTGRAYLAGPYRGAPISMAIVMPAVVGPYDLGTVVVRTALHVDPETVQIRAVSDPIPTILHGIPLSVREIRFAVDRSGFALNPTSCREKAFTGSAVSAAGAVAALGQRFQVGACESLPFRPQLRLSLTGAMKRTGHPSRRAELRARQRDGGLRRAVVILPRSQFIDQARINNPCTRVQFNQNRCPRKSILGWARAFTPLLDRPLEGPIYFRANGGERELPDIVLDLHGQIRVTQVGFVDSTRARIRTTFASIPDAPLEKVVLRLKGGKDGLLQNSRHLCRTRQRAAVRLGAHNGDSRRYQAVIKTSCRKRGTAKRGAHGRRG